MNILPENRRARFFYHGSSPQKFPPGTVGTVYYLQPPPDKPSLALAGEIRFRIMSDASHFDDGEDLKLPNGSIWQITAYNLIRAPTTWKALLSKAKEESLIDEGVVSDIQNLAGRSQKPRRANLHYEFDQPFILDLEHPFINRLFLNRSMVHQFSWKIFWHLYRTSRKKTEVKLAARYVRYVRYTGQLLVRFELSTVPSVLSASRGPKKCLVVRVLEVMTPFRCLAFPEYDLLEEPIPGGLLMRRPSRSRMLEPVLYNLEGRKDGRIIAEFAGIA
ncbi:hypothetical protein CPB84DRAFT_1743350 [Gymnopilus junonius]|uniref:Uncharacterized protein n=1 Tax=Gymnopilus junonius TaxID=109634 RepID=A0A9P5NVX2_GYMJU|nr:hypothetical protein CPB84DRAFT_1743350 [Gymnopilus junonius]